jgi:hypothetical protein
VRLRHHQSCPRLCSRPRRKPANNSDASRSQRCFFVLQGVIGPAAGELSGKGCEATVPPLRVAAGRIAPQPSAQIPACGFPAPGSCLGSNVIGLRGFGYPCSPDPWARCFSDMPVPTLCPVHALQLTLPLTGRHPSTVSASQVQCSRPTSHPRACPSFGLLPSWAGVVCWPDTNDDFHQ